MTTVSVRHDASSDVTIDLQTWWEIQHRTPTNEIEYYRKWTTTALAAFGDQAIDVMRKYDVSSGFDHFSDQQTAVAFLAEWASVVDRKDKDYEFRVVRVESSVRITPVMTMVPHA